MFSKKVRLPLGLLVFGCFFIHLTEKASLADQLWLIFAQLKNTIGLFTYKYDLLSTNNSIYEPKYGFIPHFPQRPPLSYLTRLKIVKKLSAKDLQFLIWEEAAEVQDVSDKKSMLIPVVATLKEKEMVIARFCLTFNTNTKKAIIISTSLSDLDAISNKEMNQHLVLYAFVEKMLEQQKGMSSILSNTISQRNKNFWIMVGFPLEEGSKEKKVNFLSIYTHIALDDFK